MYNILLLFIDKSVKFIQVKPSSEIKQKSPIMAENNRTSDDKTNASDDNNNDSEQIELQEMPLDDNNDQICPTSQHNVNEKSVINENPPIDSVEDCVGTNSLSTELVNHTCCCKYFYIFFKHDV